MSEQRDPEQPTPLKAMRETGIVNAMTSTSMHKHPTAFFNTRLPVLQVALNVEMMSEHLAPLLAPLAVAGAAPRVTYANLVAYKQGNRGLIRYQVMGTTRGEVCTVFGKLYPDLGQTTRANQTMYMLWADVFGGAGQELSVPRPLGCVSDLSMLVYLPAEGQFLDEAITSEQALLYMNQAGRWLGTLHSHALSLDRTFRMSTELVNLNAWGTLVSNKYPDEAASVMRIVRHLQEAAAHLRFETNVPIHKDFHYGHIVVEHGRLKVIDFDELRLGDANFDLAHFCANLHLLAYRRNNSPFQFSALQSAFLSAYAQHTGWVTNERFLYFYIYTCLKIAKQLCSVRGPRPRPEGEDQRMQVRLILDQALAALPQETAKRLASGFATQAISQAEIAALLAADAQQSPFATQVIRLPEQPDKDETTS